MTQTEKLFPAFQALFLTAGAAILLTGVALGLRFLYFFVIGEGGGHIQSVILATTLILLGFFLGMIGLLADLGASQAADSRQTETNFAKIGVRARTAVSASGSSGTSP